ncbi:hypothetical protein TCAL_08397 [Tigriopus californicus]|uniref:Uncharacterized protein n=1 Tax=Tigriopus californicus TaxID=6832 RepID=A0A553N6V7_TIGCA|nr:hypothetical protein TCAL_08397 [Tigriopus californicus]|eukprot:TCALIF_08397-PA protein Name:"Protein of unknown function" AED:0.68 eAED:0.68 QI:0/0/0/0.5/0/0.5/2/0/133
MMLGLRNAVKADLGYSQSEMVYGSPLTLPDTYFTLPSTSTFANTDEYVRQLCKAVNAHTFNPAEWHKSNSDDRSFILKGMEPRSGSLSESKLMPSLELHHPLVLVVPMANTILDRRRDQNVLRSIKGETCFMI